MSARRAPAVALVDGEHYPPVVAEALASLGDRHELRAALLLGGAEKLRSLPGAEAYGVPRLERVEPGQRATAVLAALHAGAAYAGADFRFDPPPRHPYPWPSVAVTGTGKRVGKTAVSAHLARLARDRLAPTGEQVVVVAMGRGGPPEPELVDPRTAPLTAGDLLERARTGRHAAADHLEDAVLAGVVTVGCRRCGGGLAGAVGRSNVVEGAAVAAGLRPGLTIFEGSGAAAPPIACDRTLLVSSVHAPPEEVLGHLGPVRVLGADLIVLGGAERGTEAAAARLRAGLEDLQADVPVIPVVLRPAPAVPVEQRRVAVFTTAPAAVHDALRRHLEERLGARVVAVTGALADRPALRGALASPEVARAELWLTEIKAAAVDVVAEAASTRDVELGFFDNVPEAADGSDALERALLALVDAARAGR